VTGMPERDFEVHSGGHVTGFAADHGWLAEIRFKDGTTKQVPLIGWAIVRGSLQPVVLLDNRLPTLPPDLEEIGADLIQLTDRKTDFGWQ
jgi:hypothetical protein